MWRASAPAGPNRRSDKQAQPLPASRQIPSTANISVDSVVPHLPSKPYQIIDFNMFFPMCPTILHSRNRAKCLDFLCHCDDRVMTEIFPAPPKKSPLRPSNRPLANRSLPRSPPRPAESLQQCESVHSPGRHVGSRYLGCGRMYRAQTAIWGPLRRLPVRRGLPGQQRQIVKERLMVAQSPGCRTGYSLSY